VFDCGVLSDMVARAGRIAERTILARLLVFMLRAGVVLIALRAVLTVLAVRAAVAVFVVRAVVVREIVFVVVRALDFLSVVVSGRVVVVR